MPKYRGTWKQRQYFLLEIRRASHSLNRSHRVCGAFGINLTVHHQTLSTSEHSPNDLDPAVGDNHRGIGLPV
jgi:hypothetical protein